MTEPQANRGIDFLFRAVLIGTTIIVSVWIGYSGWDYYSTPLEERFYHEQHDWFKASGFFGHGLGFLGTLMMAVGVFLYIPAKKYGFLESIIRLRYLLDIHIFLCTLGPILVLFHTTFKFGGVVSVAFWSMVLVVISGIIGRYIYIQIPRSISGRELDQEELQSVHRESLDSLSILENKSPNLHYRIVNFQSEAAGYWEQRAFYRKGFREIKSDLKKVELKAADRKEILKSIRKELKLKRGIQQLELMQRLFKYWHIAHRPFALIMLIVLIIHIVVTMGMGYTWIF